MWKCVRISWGLSGLAIALFWILAWSKSGSPALGDLTPFKIVVIVVSGVAGTLALIMFVVLDFRGRPAAACALGGLGFVAGFPAIAVIMRYLAPND